jgi:hypothetical protein
MAMAVPKRDEACIADEHSAEVVDDACIGLGPDRFT